jgi:hypothetical protein
LMNVRFFVTGAGSFGPEMATSALAAFGPVVWIFETLNDDGPSRGLGAIRVIHGVDGVIVFVVTGVLCHGAVTLRRSYDGLADAKRMAQPRPKRTERIAVAVASAIRSCSRA